MLFIPMVTKIISLQKWHTLARHAQQILYLNPEAFCECFTFWMERLREKYAHEVIAIDCKAVKGTNPKAKGMEAVYLVPAFASSNNLGLSQKSVLNLLKKSQ